MSAQLSRIKPGEEKRREEKRREEKRREEKRREEVVGVYVTYVAILKCEKKNV